MTGDGTGKNRGRDTEKKKRINSTWEGGGGGDEGNTDSDTGARLRPSILGENMERARQGCREFRERQGEWYGDEESSEKGRENGTGMKRAGRVVRG